MSVSMTANDETWDQLKHMGHSPRLSMRGLKKALANYEQKLESFTHPPSEEEGKLIRDNIQAIKALLSLKKEKRND